MAFDFKELMIWNQMPFLYSRMVLEIVNLCNRHEASICKSKWFVDKKDEILD